MTKLTQNLVDISLTLQDQGITPKVTVLKSTITRKRKSMLNKHNNRTPNVGLHTVHTQHGDTVYHGNKTSRV